MRLGVPLRPEINLRCRAEPQTTKKSAFLGVRLNLVRASALGAEDCRFESCYPDRWKMIQ